MHCFSTEGRLFLSQTNARQNCWPSVEHTTCCFKQTGEIIPSRPMILLCNLLGSERLSKCKLFMIIIIITYILHNNYYSNIMFKNLILNYQTVIKLSDVLSLFPRFVMWLIVFWSRLMPQCSRNSTQWVHTPLHVLEWWINSFHTHFTEIWGSKTTLQVSNASVVCTGSFEIPPSPQEDELLWGHRVFKGSQHQERWWNILWVWWGHSWSSRTSNDGPDQWGNDYVMDCT